MRLLLRTVIVCAVVLASTTSRADDKAEAAKHYELGKRHYNLNEFDDAIASFKSAYKLVPDPVYLFNIAQAYRLKGTKWCALSAQFYATYQREETNKKLRDSVKKRHDEMEACAKTHPQESEPAPTPAPVVTEQPPPDPTPTAKSSPAAAIVAPATPEAPPPAPARPPDSPRSRRTWGKVLLIGGGVFGAGSLLFWGGGLGFQAKLDDCRRPDVLDCPQTRIDKLGRQKDEAYVTALGLGVLGVGSAVVGYLLFRSSPKPHARLTVMPARNGAAVAWSF